MADLEEQIATKKLEIEDAGIALEEARASEANQYERMEKHVKYSYERGPLGWLEAILGADSFASVLNFATYFEGVASYSGRIFDHLLLQFHHKQILQTLKRIT